MWSLAETNPTTLELVHDLTLAAGAIADPIEATGWLADHAAEAVGSDAAALYVWNAPSRRLRLRHGNSTPLPGLAESVTSGEALAGQAFARGEPVTIEPGTADGDPRRRGLPAGVEAAIAVPVRSGDFVSGVLIVFYTHAWGTMPRRLVQGVGLIGAGLGASLQASVAQESELEAATTRGFRTSTSRLLANALDLETTMERVGQLAVPQLADWCTIDLLAPDGTVDWLALVHGDPVKVELERELTRRYPPDLAAAKGVAQTLRTGESVQYLADADHHHGIVPVDAAHLQLLSGLGPHQTLIMPLRAQGKLLGALSLMRMGADRAYDEIERTELAEHLATRCSQALINAQLYLVAQEEIAEHRRTELALRESQWRTTAILEAALDSIITYDLRGRITEFNSAAERSFGVVRADALGQLFTSVVVPAAGDDMPVAPVGGSPRRDVQLRRHDGTLRWVAISTSPLLGALGERVGTVAMVPDITERKQGEEALRANEERFRKQYKGFPLPTYSWQQVGDDFVLQDFNDAAEAVTEGLIAKGLGGSASDWYSHMPVILADLQVCATEHRTLRREMRYRYRTTGVERDLAFSYVFVPPRTVMIHTEDTTDARRAEQQRDAMAQSEKLRALGQMATGIAHDLNQSLMLVASYSDLARRAVMEEPPNLAELDDLLTTTTQAALDGGETVKRLLLFTRAAPELNSKRIDLSSVVRDAAQLTAPRWRDAAQAEGRPISLHIEATGNPMIQGSPAQLRELMTNLIFNAVDALPNGGMIRLRVVEEDGQGIIEVTDSGLGMSAEVQARVFEPFFTTKGEGGTGLGLAMVFGIVEQHGGHIDVRSELGSGTTFRSAFPLVDTSAAAEASPSVAVATGPLAPLRILAVDDEPMMTKAVMRMLKPSGHVVTVAASGEEALQELAEQTFDVVVSDMGMGAGMNGWELAEAVRTRWPGVRFLLATGWGAAIDPTDAQARGVEAVLAKPYQLADLLKVLGGTDRAA